MPVGMARDNLQRIRGINAEVEELVGRHGVTRYAQIANWAKPDVERFDRLLGQNGRIARENWIEQAQILAKGGDTAYSRDLDRRLVAGTEPGAGREGLPARTTDVSNLRSVRSEALRGADAAAGPREIGAAGRIGPASDLKRIRGIGVLIEKKLHALGVTSYEDIANWTAQEIARFGQLLDLKDRIEQEHWVERRHAGVGRAHCLSLDAARRLESDVETAEDGPGDPARAIDMSGLRSVRSEAFRGADASAEPREIGAAGRIGVGHRPQAHSGHWLADRKEASLAWHLIPMSTSPIGRPSDIDRISQTLDFKGRIERENWVEQARILAAGGQTEFSRRFDRSGGHV